MIHCGIELYSEIDKFVTDMNLLLKRVKPLHVVDKKMLGDTLGRTLKFHYQNYKVLFRKRGEPLNPRTMSRAKQEEQKRHNYSVAQLRREFRKIQKKINEQFKYRHPHGRF